MGIKRPASGSKNFNRLTETRHAAKVPVTKGELVISELFWKRRSGCFCKLQTGIGLRPSHPAHVFMHRGTCRGVVQQGTADPDDAGGNAVWTGSPRKRNATSEMHPWAPSGS